MNKRQSIFLFMSALAFLSMVNSCRKTYTPKPRAYVRIDMPDKEYVLFDLISNFRFEYPKYAEINSDTIEKKDPDWFNIDLPSLNGRIYMSYKHVDRNLSEFIEDSRNFVYKHTIKAEAINETPVFDKERKVYGILYDIKGNTASSVQFFVTDSVRHFLRGALYFNAQPDKDSMMPVVAFVRDDILQLINTLQWKE